MTLPTDICGALKGARERLCIAQTKATQAGHRDDLQTALDIIDRTGVWYCPQWSKFDEPGLPGAGLSSTQGDGSDRQKGT